MRIPHTILGAVLISVFVIACSTDSSKQQHRAASPPQAIDAGTPQERLDQVAKEYGFVVQGHVISFMLPGLSSIGGEDALMKENMEKVQKITDAVHKALGDDSTNYVINYKIR